MKRQSKYKEHEDDLVHIWRQGMLDWPIHVIVVIYALPVIFIV